MDDYKPQGSRELREPFFSASCEESYLAGMSLRKNDLVGHYRIQEEIGRGAMGIVYLARDNQLERLVAIKVICPKAMDAFGLQDEAKILAALNHPHIVSIHDIISPKGENISYIVMEYVPGPTLAQYAREKDIKLKETVAIGIQVAGVLEATHEAGVVHRDLNPANIKIMPQGIVKVLDFGISQVKATRERPLSGGSKVVGTPAYMSPEQILGKDVDHRTDIWSFGCILYEMLTGTNPFAGPTGSATAANIINLEVDSEKLSLVADARLSGIICKCLEKCPDNRYPDAGVLVRDLLDYQAAAETKFFDVRTFLRVLRRPRIMIAAAGLILVLSLGGYWLVRRNNQLRWAREDAIPEITQLVRSEQYLQAFLLARQVKKYLPHNPVLSELYQQMSIDNFTISTEPAGAQVYIRNYSEPTADWYYLGTTPLTKIAIPVGLYCGKIVKPNYIPVENAWLINNYLKGQLHIKLYCQGRIPADMVVVPAGATQITLLGFGPYEKIAIDTFLIDRHEVTNREYSRFVAAGGYENQMYWEHKFIEGGRVLSWQEALAKMVDKTGRPGPATWLNGHFPPGKDDYPVRGISWYEAAAYAKYLGKELPTIYHWGKAASPSKVSGVITAQSNFGTAGPVRVGSTPGITSYGLSDMAGNVREWCFNQADINGTYRYGVGGAWDEPSYMFSIPILLEGMNRSPKNGFRCMRYLSGKSEDNDQRRELRKARIFNVRNLKEAKPISDHEFAIIRQSLFSYDKKKPFQVQRITYETEAKDWTKEKVIINAAYGDERLGIYIFLPHNSAVRPPYQAVIEFPDMQAFRDRSSAVITVNKHIIKSGRAIIYPIFKGSYERGPIPFENTMKIQNAPLVQWAQDWMRTIDYLETRADIDTKRLVFSGGSLGGLMGAYLSAEEPIRFRACMLWLCGIPTWEKLSPARDPVNYLPHIKIPVLMTNGRFDPVFPYEWSQKPMYELLGTPEQDKYLEVIPEGEHGGWIRHTIEMSWNKFLNKYLGNPLATAKKQP